MRTDERINTIAPARPVVRPRVGMSLARLAADRGLAGLRTYDPEGFFRRARHRPEGQGASDRNSNRSGGDPQLHEPFELADFLTKARIRGPYAASIRMAVAS